MKKKFKKTAQVTLEFAFCLVMVMLILYGIVRVIRWAGFSLGDRRIEHERILKTSVSDKFTTDASSPLKQLIPDFYKLKEMNLVFNQW